MKKSIILGVFAVLIVPVFVFGQDISTEDRIAQLRAQIAVLTAQLTQLLAQQKPTSACYDFNNNLKLGDGGYGGGSRPENYSDRDVYALRNFLIKEGVADFVQEQGTAGSSIKNSTFNEAVQRAVIKFQAKYGIEQTGFVGPLTRGQLNKMYGCAKPLTLNVVSPAGGETWEAGDIQKIVWKVDPTIQKINIYLHIDIGCFPPSTTCPAAASGEPPYVLDKNIPTDMDYNWIVGTDTNDKRIPEGYYKVRICNETDKKCSTPPFYSFRIKK